MTIQDKKISYRDLADNYLGNFVLSNELFRQLVINSYESGNEFEVDNGDYFEYFNRYGNEISREQWEECQDYDLEGDMLEKEFFQFYLIDSSTYHTLCDLTDEAVVYFPDFDAAFWCVDHWGTPWEHVFLTIHLRDYTDEL